MVNSNQEYYNIIAAVDLLGTDTCKALPFLYAFSGCDIVSSFFSKGKCEAWDVWQQSENKDEARNGGQCKQYVSNAFVFLA